MTAFDYVSSALRTIRLEADAVSALSERIDGQFTAACEMILNCSGRIIVTGMGKSGHIGSKIAATLASTGTPAFFVHPGEASHGDLGMITKNDIVLAISYSGSSNEIVTLLPLFKRAGIKIISMTANAQSTLGEVAEINLDISVVHEACPLDLAPTSSTTATLVMGDALAIALLEARGFTAEDFAFSHPGGALGRKLLLRLTDVMHSGDNIPRVSPDTQMLDALMVMSDKGFGMTTVMEGDQLLGIFTDGDLRRCIDRGVDIRTAKVGTLMNTSPKMLRENTLAAEALALMEQAKINVLLITNEQKKLVGVVKINDLLRAGII
ncbi:KpsF/GutQ family sugar-phosphate isomerase [Cellvibrio sp. NN19]|uniref:KpsF/GutQ family sugar-phosphate isomerase n=1 Tax=Cellvibrio chitinivorans TaxID=3102792 RepID=UPI002B401404|nr:KpsF/GutQ family sugar-phosphate isomerase [Cellvibrio sp. NN19]